MNELQTSEYNTEIFQELADDVWEEAARQQSQTDLEREQYKKRLNYY